MTGGDTLELSDTLEPALIERSRLRGLDYLLVAILTIAVFTPVLFSQFSPVDDQTMLLHNKQITEPSWAQLVDIWSQPKYRIYMPLPLTVWEILGAISIKACGYVAPLGFKIVSILIHAGAAAAAAWTLSILSRTRWPAIIGALVFALHPFQVESVAWTTGMKDLLCGLFAILAIGSYARFAWRNPMTHWRDGWWWASVGWSLLAMCSKPTAMTMPALLIGVDLFCRRCSAGRRAAALLPMLIPAGICALIIGSAQKHTSAPQLALPWRPLVAADAYAFYLRMIAWPLHMCPDYGRSPPRVYASGALYWTWLIPATVLVVAGIVRNRYVWLGLLLFVVPILPTSGLVPFDMQQYSTVADHYMYQPMLGIGLIATWAAIRWRSVMAVALPLAVMAWGVISWRYATVWRNPETLFGYAGRVNPNSWMTNSVLANIAIAHEDYVSADRYIA
ncbi:MAG: hypothetical protein ACTHLZ_15135, partial [Tepidisphaeraceae bacterium]